MKCWKCFYACFIGEGVYGDFPVLHCRRTNKNYTYKANAKDDMARFEIGCDVPWQTVAKAKRDYIKKLESEVKTNE